MKKMILQILSSTLLGLVLVVVLVFSVLGAAIFGGLRPRDEPEPNG